jgi:hypothetical protein
MLPRGDLLLGASMGSLLADSTERKAFFKLANKKKKRKKKQAKRRET